MSKVTQIRTGATAKIPTQQGDRSKIPNQSVGTNELRPLSVTQQILADSANPFPWIAKGFLDYVNVGSLAAVNSAPGIGQFRSSVVGRAPIMDLTNDLSINFGPNRIMTQQIYELDNEQGPTGQTAWGVVNDTANQIRFVGDWRNDNGTGHGPAIKVGLNTTDYVEVTFWGTALKVLFGNYNGSGLDFRATVDGGSEGGNFAPPASSVVTAVRNYNQLMIIDVVTDLSLGLHTVKIRQAAASDIRIDGFEILSEPTSLNLNPGSAFIKGIGATKSLASTQPYASGFTNTYGTPGTRGGRVLAYLDTTGVLKRDIRYTDSQLNLSSADHSNEDLMSVHHWREFSASRGDDFSSNAVLTSAVSRVFALDDNSTALLGSNIFRAVETLCINATNDYIDLVFVGSGLDIEVMLGGAGTHTTNVFVDDVSIGTLSSFPAYGTVKIVSGLRYGSHRVRLVRSTPVTSNIAITRFKVYSPKKPVLPANCIELGDYCLMANYVAATVGPFTVAQGVLRKSPSREFTYVEGSGGTSSWSLGASPGQPMGYQASTDRQNASFAISGWCQGFEYRTQVSVGRGSDTTWTANGLTLNTTNFPGLLATGYGGATFNTSTGKSDFSVGASDGGISITGLPLDSYTFKATNGTAGVFLQLDSFDLITPVHSQKFNRPGLTQNTLMVGNQAIADSRVYTPIRDSVKFRGESFAPIGFGSSTNVTEFTPMPDMIVPIPDSNKGGWFAISYNATGSGLSSGQGLMTQISVDGYLLGAVQYQTGTQWSTLSDRLLVYLSPGEHIVQVMWKVSASTSSVDGHGMTVEEQ